MKPTFQEIAALIIALASGAALVGLKLTGNDTPEELKGIVGLAVFYIFGSRTSKPEME